MTHGMTRWSNKALGRLTGFTYLIVVITGILSLVVVPQKFHHRDDPARTIAELQNDPTIYRLGIIIAVLLYLAYLALAFLFYYLLGHVSRRHGVAMVTLVALSIPLSFANLSNRSGLLELATNEHIVNSLPSQDLEAQTLFLLEQDLSGNLLVSVFWGLWLLPLGYLIFRSSLIPRVLGLFLIVGCFGYLTDFVGNLMSDSYRNSPLRDIIGIPSTIGEIGTCLWLLMAGARNEASGTSTVSTESV